MLDSEMIRRFRRIVLYAFKIPKADEDKDVKSSGKVSHNFFQTDKVIIVKHTQCQYSKRVELKYTS